MFCPVFLTSEVAEVSPSRLNVITPRMRTRFVVLFSSLGPKPRTKLETGAAVCCAAMEAMETDIDSELMQKFSCMGTTDKDILITEFQRLLGFQLNPAGCAFFLDMTNW